MHGFGDDRPPKVSREPFRTLGATKSGRVDTSPAPCRGEPLSRRVFAALTSAGGRAVCSAIGLAVNDAASKASDSADQIGIQVSNTLDHLRAVALTGTSFLVGDAPEDSAEMGTASRQVDAGLAGNASLPGRSSNESSDLDSAARAWGLSFAVCQVVLATPVNGGAPTAERHALEE